MCKQLLLSTCSFWKETKLGHIMGSVCVAFVGDALQQKMLIHMAESVSDGWTLQEGSHLQ